METCSCEQQEEKKPALPRILVLFHYYLPDDVAAAKHFSDLCEGLASRGWSVEVWPSNRSCHNYKDKYSLKKEDRNGVRVRRVWRPPLRQHSFLGRVLNSIWMQKAWAWRYLFLSSQKRPEIVLTGTDPMFSVLIAPFLRRIGGGTKIAHWCFDVYPEAPIADGVVAENGLIAKGLRWALRRAYSACGLVADLGPCMRERLERYPAKARATLTPWSLEEPPAPLTPDPREREELFGESKLCLLYSGSFARAHSVALTLSLARELRGKPVAFAFGVRGSRTDELKAAVTPEDTNIRFAGFAPPDRLAARLSAADIHIVGLGKGWEGIAVPSKFFGSLAAGRPVLFEGSEDSSVARWIKEYGVGWVLRPGRLWETADELLRFSGDPAGKEAMFRRCHEVYRAHFSSKVVLDRWDRECRALLAEREDVV